MARQRETTVGQRRLACLTCNEHICRLQEVQDILNILTWNQVDKNLFASDSRSRFSGFHLDTSFFVKLVQLFLPALDWNRLTSQAQLGLPSHIVLLLITQAFDRNQKRVLLEDSSFL